MRCSRIGNQPTRHPKSKRRGNRKATAPLSHFRRSRHGTGCGRSVPAQLVAARPAGGRFIPPVPQRSLVPRAQEGRSLVGFNKRAKQAMLLVEGTGREEERIRRPVIGGTFAEGQGPEAVDLDRMAVNAKEWAAVLELATGVRRCRGGVSVDPTVAKVADEQVVAEPPEIGRC